MNAIAIHQNGNSLAHSAEFRALLPQDEHADVSAVLYQNLAPVIRPDRPATYGFAVAIIAADCGGDQTQRGLRLW